MANDETTGWVDSLFRSVDARDTGAFVSFLCDDVSFRFGNAPVVNGRSAVATVVGGFFESIDGVSHVLEDTWRQEDAVICHGTVTYTRRDSSILTVPFANVFRTSDGLIREYLIFADLSELHPAGL